MAYGLGGNFSINRQTGASWNNPAWTPITAARDVKLDLTPSLFDASNRTLAVDMQIPTRFKAKVEFDALWDAGVALLALRNAFLTGAAIELAALDGLPATGAWGIHAMWAVTSFALEFPLQDGQKLKVALEPHGNYAGNPPVFYTDATGAAGTADAVGVKRVGAIASVNAAGVAVECKDVKLTLTPYTFDSSDRSTQFDTIIPTRFKYEVELQLLWNTANPRHLAFRTAFLAGTPVDLTILDGAYVTAGAWGVLSSWAVNSFPMDAKLRDGQLVDIKLTPHANGATLPQLITI